MLAEAACCLNAQENKCSSICENIWEIWQTGPRTGCTEEFLFAISFLWLSIEIPPIFTHTHTHTHNSLSLFLHLFEQIVFDWLKRNPEKTFLQKVFQMKYFALFIQNSFYAEIDVDLIKRNTQTDCSARITLMVLHIATILWIWCFNNI